MDVGKVAVRILGLVLWVVVIIIDLSHKFYGIWSLVGYAVLACLLWVILKYGDSVQDNQHYPEEPCRDEPNESSKPKPIPFNN
jgi:hypothetical protein